MPRLHVLNGSQRGQVFLIHPPGPYRVGRHLDTEFPLFDRRMSRRHFQLDFRDQGCLLTDLRSLGGTYVNDRRIKTALLGPDDTIRAGNTHLRFDLDFENDAIVGRDLAGYRVLQKVGIGGMGTVYRARQRSLARIVALKVLPEEIAGDEQSSTRFIHEARAAARLSHANVVRVYDVNLVDEVLFYSMEFMARGNVLDLLSSKGRLSIQRAVTIGLDVARALEYAGRLDVVHRDIKPANLLIHQSGVVKLGDLGIATRQGVSSSRNGNGEICGSPYYMAPEQALGRHVDTAADVYALGATLYQLLAGRPPFALGGIKEILKAHIHKTPTPLEKIRPEVPLYLARLVEVMMSKESGQRPGPPEELVAKLEAVVDIVGDQDPLEVRRRRSLRLQTTLLVVAGLLGVCLGYAVARALL